MSGPSQVRMRALNAPEAAHAIRLVLGPVRAWRHVLADMARGHSTYYGEVLLPYATVQGRCKRPLYLAGDVAAFIKAALIVAPPGANPRQVVKLDIDVPVTDLGKHWRARRATIVAPKTVSPA